MAELPLTQYLQKQFRSWRISGPVVTSLEGGGGRVYLDRIPCPGSYSLALQREVVRWVAGLARDCGSPAVLPAAHQYDPAFPADQERPNTEKLFLNRSLRAD